MLSEQTTISRARGTKEKISNSGGRCPVTLVIADLVSRSGETGGRVAISGGYALMVF
jgi:hypothetical protein